MSNALKWFKSSYSTEQGGDCVEVAIAWHKSSYSTPDGDSCVEVAACPTAIHVRDSKIIGGPELRLAPHAWAALTGWVTR